MCGRRGGHPSRGRRMCGRREGRPSPIKVEGLRKRRRHDWGRWADDAEVIPPKDDGDGRTTRRSSLPRTTVCGRRGGHPSHADVATGFTPGRIARTDRTQGHNRGVNPLATWKCGRRGGRPSQGRRMCGRRGGHPSPLKCRASAIKVQGLPH